MCCFSVASPAGWVQRLLQPRIHVSATNIYARMVAPGVQALAYGMNLSTRHEVAMVLPLPVAPGSGEDAVTFIDLHEHPHMFVELRHLFDPPVSRAKGGLAALAAMPQHLVVHEVGAFIASYVPTVGDFARLDPRFRMPGVLFDAVPAYRDHGFAVFQLKPGTVTVHPMAFTFPTRDAERLFFPTVHMHDGVWHRRAKFDHGLFCQRPASDGGFERSTKPPARDYAGLVDATESMQLRRLRGRLPNADTWVSLSSD